MFSSSSSFFYSAYFGWVDSGATCTLVNLVFTQFLYIPKRFIKENSSPIERVERSCRSKSKAFVVIVGQTRGVCTRLGRVKRIKICYMD